jgi:hypothetical protein
VITLRGNYYQQEGQLLFIRVGKVTDFREGRTGIINISSFTTNSNVLIINWQNKLLFQQKALIKLTYFI